MTIFRSSARRAVLCVLAIGVLWQAVGRAAFDSWAVTPSMGVARKFHAMAALLDGTVLVMGGEGSDFYSLYSTTLYDPQANTWTPAAGMNSWREDFTATALADGSVLAVGGMARIAGYTPFIWSSAEVYSGGSWRTVPSMANSRFGHAAVRLKDGRVLVSGGSGYVNSIFTSPLRSAEIYTPGAGWNSVGNMVTGRVDHTLSLLPDGRVLAVGGAAGAEIFDPVTGAWTAAPSPAAAHNGHTATVLPSGRLLIAGGGNAVAELFDSVTSTWLPAASMASSRQYHTATLLATGRVLVAGGSGGTSAEEYDPATNTWVSAGTMDVSRSNHTAAVLKDGRVLLAGGTTASGTTAGDLYSMDPVISSLLQSNATSQAQVSTLTASNQTLTTQVTTLQDQNSTLTALNASLTAANLQLQAELAASGQSATGANDAVNQEIAAIEAADGTTTWKAVGSMATARSGYTLTLLSDGRALAVGSTTADNSGTTIPATEIYDPTLQSWRPAASLNHSRISHSAVRLTDGRVLVAGGVEYENRPNPPFQPTFVATYLDSAELYDPASGVWTSAASMGSTRVAFTLTLLKDGRVLATGGSTGGAIVNSAEIYDPATDTWTAAASMGSARVSHAATRLADGRVLVAGGGSATNATGGVEIYDPSTDTWTAAAAMHVDRRGAFVLTTLSNGRVLVAGGFQMSSSYAITVLDSAELYDAVTNTWTNAPSLSAARSGAATASSADGRVWVVGGYSSTAELATVEIYDPATGRWRPGGSLTTARSDAGALMLSDGSILVAGGVNSSTAGYRLASTEIGGGATAQLTTALAQKLLASQRLVAAENEIVSLEGDAGRGVWTAGASMAEARMQHTGTLLSTGQVLVAGGYQGYGYDWQLGYVARLTAGAELFDPATDSWSSTSAMTVQRYQHTATALADGRVLVVGGVDRLYQPIGSAEIFDPQSGAWTAAGQPATARAGNTSTRLADGRVLVAGGYDFVTGVQRSAELYDPATNIWTSAAAMHEARSNHTATLLSDGRVLVIAGFGNSSLPGVEIYNPTTNTWTAASSMILPRFGAAATLLPDGTVLVSGGSVAGADVFSTVSIASVEIYDPAHDTWSPTESMSVARSGHTAVLLANGLVQVVGGSGSAGLVGSVETYDPALGTWRSGGTLGTTRSQFSATPIGGERLLIAGGMDGSGTILSSVEISAPSLAAQNAQLTAALATATASATSLQAQVNTLTASQATLQSQVASLTSANSSLTAQLAAANQTIAGLRGQVTTLTTQLNAANQTISDRNGTIAQLQSANAALTTQLTAAAQTIASLQAQLASLNTQLATANETIAAQTATLASEAATIATRDATIASQATTITEQTATITAETATIASQTATIAALQGQLASLSASLGQVFNSPSFVIAGATPQQQLQNLVTAIRGLNYGQQQALYKNLGGK